MNNDNFENTLILNKDACDLSDFIPLDFNNTTNNVAIIGGGLAGSEAALTLSSRGINVDLFEMRPAVQTPVHKTAYLAELVCSNSFKSEKPDSAAGMLKQELSELQSHLYQCALKCRVNAGGALAVNRELFSLEVENLVSNQKQITVINKEIKDLVTLSQNYDAIIVATGPLTSDGLAESIVKLTGDDMLAFYDAAAPVVISDSLNMSKLFRQDRYGKENSGDYLNAPLNKSQYETLMNELITANKVIAKDFEQKELFQACQPIEEIAKCGIDAARFGAMKPVGLIDPTTGKRPWAAVQLRAEDKDCQSYNLVGFQTNLTFSEQKRIFRMIPGLENAEFARYGVMHRNTFINAPKVLDNSLRFIGNKVSKLGCPIFVSGQLSGTEGYTEAIRSGLHAAISVWCLLNNFSIPTLSSQSVFGSLINHSTNPETIKYQPMHVNFGIIEPLDCPIKSKQQRYEQYSIRGNKAIKEYVGELKRIGFF